MKIEFNENFEPKNNVNKENFIKGIKDGIPIGLGYFAVAFTLGITAKNIGLTVVQAGLLSLGMHASAGEFAFMTILSSSSGILEMILMQIVVNLRYLLMSCALSQKIDKNIKFRHRIIVSYFITDEIFALDVGQKGEVNPFYNYGMITVASPGWVIGTMLGVILGNILPLSVSSAMNIALYGMFLAIIIPESKKSKVIMKIVVVSMISSLLFSVFPYIKELSSGMRIIILTILISAIAAKFYPVKEEDNEL